MGFLDLPDELLEKTFDEARCTKKGSRAMHSMLTVCRRTSRIAEQTMLHSVQIKRLHQLELFACKVAHRPMTYDPPAGEPGRHVRNFYILGAPEVMFRTGDIGVEDLTLWTDPITSVLTVLPLLRCFTLNAVPMTRGIIACLITDYLKSLTLRISSDRDVSVDVLPYVGQLKGLEHLHITYDPCDDYTAAEETFKSMDALVLPGVKQFAWSSEFIGNADADYVASCRFHKACSVFVALDYDIDLSTNLAPFFAAHSFASVTLHASEDTVAGLASQLVAVNCVKLTLDTPPLELLKQGRLPSRLKINIQLDEEEEDAEDKLENFWEFLREIPSFSERGSRVTKLSIVTRVNLAEPFKTLGREFRWSGNTDRTYSRFVKQLIPEANRLYKEGVVIVDEKGRNVMQLT